MTMFINTAKNLLLWTGRRKKKKKGRGTRAFRNFGRCREGGQGGRGRIKKGKVRKKWKTVTLEGREESLESATAKIGLPLGRMGKDRAGKGKRRRNRKEREVI